MIHKRIKPAIQIRGMKFDCRAAWGDTSVSLSGSTRRHRKTMKKTALLLPVALFLTSLPCAAQGLLTPSGGTMKTLEQIELRQLVPSPL